MFSASFLHLGKDRKWQHVGTIDHKEGDDRIAARVASGRSHDFGVAPFRARHPPLAYRFGVYNFAQTRLQLMGET
jgi:hypothetical protein